MHNLQPINNGYGLLMFTRFKSFFLAFIFSYMAIFHAFLEVASRKDAQEIIAERNDVKRKMIGIQITKLHTNTINLHSRMEYSNTK